MKKRFDKLVSINQRLALIGRENFYIFFVWFPAALAMVYVKSQYLNYMIIGRVLGRTEIPSLTLNDSSRAYLFTFFERLSFYRFDLLLGFIVIPFCYLAIHRLIPKRWRIVCIVTVSFVTILFLHLQMRGFWSVGQFQSWALWYDSIRWGMLHPEDAQRYVGKGMLLKVSIIFLVIVALGILSGFSQKDRLGRSFFIGMLLLTYNTAIVATLLSWCSSIQTTPYHRGALITCCRAFFDINDFNISKFDAFGRNEILTKWHEVTRSPERKSIPDYFGVAKNYDVICFVMETAPSRYIDLNGNMNDFPNLKRLKKQAWVASRHFTTYPYTSSALFSILTSWYPTDINHLRSGQLISPGMMRSLSMCGYKTAAYLPTINSDPTDEVLHRAVGISKVIYAESSAASNKKQTNNTDWHDKVNRDRIAMELMKKDILSWIRGNQRYATLFLPQIGHGPWPDVTGNAGRVDIASRGHAIMALQDKWLGELMSYLKSVGRLNRTIILVTGDHGIRTKVEDPDFVGGKVDPYSFEVPCVLFAPNTLEETVVIPWRTSHIDLSPSILDLLGVTEGRVELGSPVWDDRLSKRTTFFYANKYLGADGFYENGNYYMYNYISETVNVNDAFKFDEMEPLQQKSSIGRYVTEKLSDAIAIQYRISRVFSIKKYE